MNNLIDIIKSRKAMDLLDFLIENQDQEFYQSELVKKVKISKNTLSKWVTNLLKNNIVSVRSMGKTKCYKLRKTHPILKQIKILLALAKIGDVVKLFGSGVEVYLYGSVARGEDDQVSDVDILVIGEIEKKELIDLVEKIQIKLKRDVKPLVLTPLEYSILARKDKALYENIERSKIRLV